MIMNIIAVIGAAMAVIGFYRYGSKWALRKANIKKRWKGVKDKTAVLVGQAMSA
jgi:hypothetical protein